MAQSATIAALAAALCETQFEMEGAKKDNVNPHFKSRYADLASVWNAAKAALHKHGLAIVQAPEPYETGIQLRTVLLHKSGEWIDSTIAIPAQQQSAQGFGSAMSYARRYALAAMIGIVADEDDDGNAASQPARNGGSSYEPRQQPQQQANGGGGKASEKQIKMLFAIWNKAGYEGKLSEWVNDSYGCALEDLSIKDASAAIETLQQQQAA